MLVKIDKSFEKDVKKIKDRAYLQRIAAVIRDIQKARSVKEIKNIKKLSHSKNEYRIRVGNYRIGLILENDEVELIRCLHRKDIYKYFPRA